jgi:hypothetical protein
LAGDAPVGLYRRGATKPGMGFNTVICIGKMMLKLWGVPNVPTISYLLSRFIDVYNMHPANQYDI